jgi:hypothetical protein
MTTVVAVLGAVIAAFGALIAYFQWRTAHQRVVLDLFDRRIAVFREIEEAAKGILNAQNGTEMEKPFWSFVRAEANARFLFGVDVIAALEALRSDLADAMSFTGIEQGPEYNKMNDRKHEARQNIASFIQVKSAPLFAPYIRLDQKMSGLWWQRLCG